MSVTNIRILNEKTGVGDCQSDHIKWTGSEKPLKLRKSPFPSVESVLVEIEECINARKLMAQRQS